MSPPSMLKSLDFTSVKISILNLHSPHGHPMTDQRCFVRIFAPCLLLKGYDFEPVTEVLSPLEVSRRLSWGTCHANDSEPAALQTQRLSDRHRSIRAPERLSSKHGP